MTKRINAKDWSHVSQFVVNEQHSREQSKFRKEMERIWMTVDQQVCMEPPQKVKSNPHQKSQGGSAIQLGELSRASEVLSADVRRMSFPQNRMWFESHSDLKPEIDPETGIPFIDPNVQKRMDGQLRALMSQQHLDFSLKERVGVSIKEALHHGSYVATVEWQSMVKVSQDNKVDSSTSAPVWVPHSMWNCYPDESKSVQGTNMFYNGSMIIKSWMKRSELISQKGEEWFNLNKIKPTDKDEDLEILTYYGDIVIPRKSGKDIFLPNSIVKVERKNNMLVYYKENTLDVPPIIYVGYEKLDGRNPYFFSPLMKMSPTQKIASTIANRFIDLTELKARPPTLWNGNDPDLQKNPPQIIPGWQGSTKSQVEFTTFDVGDTSTVLASVQFWISELQKGTSVDAVRSGMSSSVEQTATEVERTRQGGQIRTIDFVDKHELQGLRPFLYIQHQLNKIHLNNYPFYNPEVDAPDFERLSKGQLTENVHFDVVGSRGLIEEQQRQAGMLNITQFLMSMPQTARLPKAEEIAKELYMDAGVKNPERFLNIGGDPLEEQLETAIAQYEQAIAQLQEELTKFQFQDEEHSLEKEQLKTVIKQKELEKEQLVTVLRSTQELLRVEKSIPRKTTQ